MREEQSPGGCGVLVGMTLTGLAGSQQQFPNAGSLISWESPAFTPQGQPSADLKRVRSAETKGLGQRARSGRAGSKFTLRPFGTLSLVPTGAAARVGRHGDADRTGRHRPRPSNGKNVTILAAGMVKMWGRGQSLNLCRRTPVGPAGVPAPQKYQRVHRDSVILRTSGSRGPAAEAG